MWWISAAAQATTCDLAAIDALSLELSKAAPERRLALAASAWRDLCTDDPVLDVQLDQISSARPESYWLVELQTSVLDTSRWNKACPGGSLALSMATKLAPHERRGHLWKTCEMDRWPGLSQDEWARGDGLLVLPLLAAWTLTDGGVPEAKAVLILRALSLGG